MEISLLIYRILILASFMIVSGCASTGTNPADPWESWNRKVYSFNKTLDKTIAKPAAAGYKAITPDFVETGVSNVFSNILDIPNFLNNLLQGKGKDSLSDLSRFVINSTLGIAGLWDPASSMGLNKHDEDFGQTLAVWGVSDGPYLMLPVLGPSTLRDSLAYPINSEMNLLNHIDNIPTRNQMNFLDLVAQRAKLIKLESQLEAATDEYLFVRDIWLQNRKYKIFDGQLPLDDDFECDEEDEEDCEF